jgi:hypothetical protein
LNPWLYSMLYVLDLKKPLTIARPLWIHFPLTFWIKVMVSRVVWLFLLYLLLSS